MWHSSVSVRETSGGDHRRHAAGVRSIAPELPGWVFLLIVLAVGAFILLCMIVHWLGALVVFAMLIWSIGRLLLWLVQQLLR